MRMTVLFLLYQLFILTIRNKRLCVSLSIGPQFRPKSLKKLKSHEGVSPNSENECGSVHLTFSFRYHYATLIEETQSNAHGAVNRTLIDSSRHRIDCVTAKTTYHESQRLQNPIW